MTGRTERRDSTKCRRICFTAHRFYNAAGQVRLRCHICKVELDPTDRKPEKGWRADHIRRWAEGGEDTAENLWPICMACDATKAPRDTREVAKGKRAGEGHYGIKRPSRPMMGSKASGWKHTFRSGWVRR